MEGALEFRIVEHYNQLFGWITLQVISQTFFFCTSHRLTHTYIYLLNRAVMQLYKRGEGKRHYHENKAVDLQVELHSYPHPWP